MSDYSLEKDHEAIKKQIKEWKQKIDEIAGQLEECDCGEEYADELKVITDQMIAAINK